MVFEKLGKPIIEENEEWIFNLVSDKRIKISYDRFYLRLNFIDYVYRDENSKKENLIAIKFLYKNNRVRSLGNIKSLEEPLNKDESIRFI